jgi:DNA-binding transcriptional ArsR family regulator
MVQFLQSRPADLDRTLGALADPTRRELVELLGDQGEASITWIAERFAITLTGARKHVTVLEEAGLVYSVKRGRTRRCSLTERPLVDAWMWFDTYGRMLAERLDRLDEFLTETKGDQR